MPSDPFDYVIVGGGTAGCLLANRLSADPDVSVLLLEAGGSDRYPWIHIPVGYLYCIGNPRTDWLYQTEPDPGLNGRSLRYPRGKTLGGCSSINGMIYMRGQRRDYDYWAESTGDDAWCWAQCLPDFTAHEDHYRLDDGADPVAANGTRFADYHGHGGEWRVEQQRLRWPILESFADACVEAGHERTDDFNAGDNAGVGYFEVNQRAGWRWNTVKAFLAPARGRPNLTIWTGAQVERLLLEPDSDGRPRCTGAAVRPGSDSVNVHARREVLLTAGAVATPQLLQLSGIGPGALLQGHGISVQVDAPGVGGNLQDHLQIRAVYKIQGAATLNTLANSWLGKCRIGLEYLLRRSGPMSMAPSQFGAFIRSTPEQPHADLEFHVQPLSLDGFGEGLHDFPAFTASVCNLNPESRGTVTIRSARFDEPPAIAPNYLSTDNDRRVAAQSLRRIREIVGQPALASYQPTEWRPGLTYQSDDELVRLAGDIANTIFHPVGTAKMGRADDPQAVVDPRLRVRGVSGLRVVDASVMPTITSGNTNSPVLMIAEKAARWIRQEQQGR